MNETLRDITLRNFRSYTEASFEFENGVNIIIGPNASGKTNLLEAVHCVCLGKGLRSSDSGLIKINESWLRLEANTTKNERAYIVEKSIDSNKTKKKNIINNNTYARLKFDQIIPTVVFLPDDLRLTTGSPERRRSYLDKLLSQLIPTFRTDLLAYERILKQRNTSLKNMSANSSQLFAWNIQLVEKGSKIVKDRVDLIGSINKRISDVYSNLAGIKSDIKIAYSSNIATNNFNESFLSLLERNLNLDKERGTTSVGPHRDDIIITINGEELKKVASRGENRTFVLALKLLELELIKNVHDKNPLVLLDDVFSELDGLRRKMLTSYLKDKQTILTTTDADVISKNISSSSNFIAI